MAGLLDTLRSGTWLTADRARLWALAVLAASGAALVFLIATSSGLTDYQGRPLGTDFASFYAAGTLVLDGHAHGAFDPAVHFARQQALFGPSVPYYGWLYPPFFLFIAAALALLPYLLAFLIWQGATFALYLLAMRALLRARPAGMAHLRGLATLLIAAFPAVFITLGHGQNGFLTTALFAGALATLERRPGVAGVMFGLLVYKPQFGLMIPLALLASGRWRTIAAAATTAAALTLVTLLAFGPEIWSAFFASSKVARSALLETGEVGWHKVQSTLAWVRMWGGSIPLSYAVQAGVTLTAGCAVLWLYRSKAPAGVKAAGLLTASIVAAFHSHDYDLMLLAPVIALLAIDGAQRGFVPYEKTLLAAAWLVPLATRSVAEATAIPLGTITTLMLLVLILGRAGAAVPRRLDGQPRLAARPRSHTPQG